MLVIALLAAALSATPDGYVLIKGRDDIIVEDGNFQLDEMAAIREAYGPNVFWFRSGGRDYIIRDAAVLKQIDDLFTPQRDLGKKQAALGAKQATLGSKQAQLGARQAAAGSDARIQDELAGRQDELAREQESLGRIQEDLGRKQEEMSREIRDKLGSLTKDWVRSGVAKPLHR